MCHTIPDISFTIGMVCRFMQKSKVSHRAATKRILRCLKETLDYGILFPAADEVKECKLMVCTDSSWCVDVEDKKSTFGYVFMLSCAPVA